MKVSINWNLHCANYPHINIEGVTPKFEYEEIALEDGTFYFAIDQVTGAVDFMFHDPLCETGFGGAVFKLPMKDGSIREIKGPWSSRAGALEDLIGIPVVDVYGDIKATLKSKLDLFIPEGVFLVKDELGWSASVNPDRIVKRVAPFSKARAFILENGMQASAMTKELCVPGPEDGPEALEEYLFRKEYYAHISWLYTLEWESYSKYQQDSADTYLHEIV